MSNNYINVNHDDSDNETVIEIPSPRQQPEEPTKKIKDLVILKRWNICCFLSVVIVITIIIILIITNM